MVKKVATPKQTSGDGFSFENKVATYYAIKMFLADKAFEAEKGQIYRIDFQVRNKGWYLDDILLTLRQNGNETHVALSVKSNIQFWKKSAPSDFVEAVWEQILHKDSDVFKTDSDMMGLVTVCHPINQKNAIQEILKFAKSHDPQQLEQTLKVKGYTSKEVCSLFNSFKCPDTLVGSNTNNLSPADILKSLYVIEFDFENDISGKEGIAISDCLKLLRNGSNQEAIKLWHTMLETVNAIRIKGGYVDRDVLVKKIKFLYDLKDFPDYAGDWQSLRSWSIENIKAIRDKIGGTLNLQRNKQKKDLSEKLDNSKTLASLGTSGIGKTVLAKLLAQDLHQSNTVIWLSADALKKGIISSPNQITGIKHSLIELISNFTSPKGLIILDRIERLQGESDLQELRKLIDSIYLDDAWKLLITCRTEHWERIQGELLGFINIGNLKTYSIEYLDNDDLQLVFDAFPQIRQLVYRAQLGQLIKLPKIIDLIATKIQNNESIAQIKWVGETDLISWLWESIKLSFEDGYSLIVFMQNLAERQADESEFVTPITKYKPDEISYLHNLKSEGICTEQEGRISFQHDLYADWTDLTPKNCATCN
ncbi:MAG: hypothetical protein WAK60_01950 [Sedimentisphaerales bacterium]